MSVTSSTSLWTNGRTGIRLQWSCFLCTDFKTTPTTLATRTFSFSMSSPPPFLSSLPAIFCLSCQMVLFPKLQGPLLLAPLTPFPSPSSNAFSYPTHHGEHVASHEQEILVLFQLLCSPIVLHLQTHEGLRNSRDQREKLEDIF